MYTVGEKILGLLLVMLAIISIVMAFIPNNFLHLV